MLSFIYDLVSSFFVTDIPSVNVSLAKRMKSYELECDTQIESPKCFIIRLDGRCFSKFTKRFKTKESPFDPKFAKAMIWTMLDLVKKFGAKTGYTHSDEISLIFTPDYNEYRKTFGYQFNGRIQKLLSLMASFCSVRFAYHFAKILNINPNSDEKLYDLILEQMFDARIICFYPLDLHEIVNHMIWRSIHDCSRNCISTYTRNYFSAKQMHGKRFEQMVEMLKSVGVNWETDVPMWQKYGVYWKSNGARIFKIKYDDNIIDDLLEKNWSECETESINLITKDELDNLIN